MQKARFYDRMVFAGTFCQCFLQEHETEVSQGRFVLQHGSSFLLRFFIFSSDNDGQYTSGNRNSTAKRSN